MKRITGLVLTVIWLLCGCTSNIATEETNSVKAEFSSGVWFSFSEINAMLNSEKGFKEEFSAALDNCVNLGIDEVYIHVRAYCDSLYPSDYFPLLEEAKRYDYDVFDYAVSTCHNRGIKVHAWVNPYRVLTSSEDISALDTSSPAYRWLNDDTADNDKNVCFSNGIYLNPAEYEVRELVINGLREIAVKYDVDGIHFDDYFYPTSESNFDSASYEEYKETCDNPLSLEDWRRANVNALISGCYTAIKFIDKNIIFSVSPMASIQKNYNELYADVSAWVKNGCLDRIIPQLYFGFNYPDKAFGFDNLLKEWKELVKSNDEVELMIGLATYKIGTDSQNDSAEWGTDDDIIARQAEICKSDGRISGFVCFSYTSLFSGDELNTRQRDNLIKIIKET